MKIAYGKFGSSILFNEKRWSSHGGCMDAPWMIEALAKCNPNDQFYLIGRSDYSRLSPLMQQKINPHVNIIDPWADYGKEMASNDDLAFLGRWFSEKGIKLDCGVLYSGPAGNANIPGRIKTVDGTRIAEVLFCFAHYMGPIVEFLNTSGLPYFTLTPDPRYHPVKARDLYNLAKFSLSQFNGQNKVKHILSYEDQTCEITNIKTVYAGIETLFLTKRQRIDVHSLEKTNDMMIILNEGGNGGLKRGPMLKEYVLDHEPDIEVFGKWSEEWMKYPQMKGPMHITQLEEKLLRTKFTFIIPIQHGWVTAKYWEMLSYGVLPFLHPSYDTQGHLPVPEILRTKSAGDFREKYEALRTDEELYRKTLSEAMDGLLDKYYDGTFINNAVMKTAYRIAGKNPNEYVLTSDDVAKINSTIPEIEIPEAAKKETKSKMKIVESADLCSFFEE